MSTAVFNLLRSTFQEWNNDKCPRMGAALAYYTVFSLAPLMVIAIAIAGLVFGAQAARGELVDELATTIGRPAAVAVEDLLAQNCDAGGNTLVSLAGLAVLLLGDSGVFVELEDALNTIWKVPAARSATVLAFIRDRVLSFSLVLGTGFLLLVSLLLSAGLSALARFLTPQSLPGGLLLWQLVNLLVSYLFIALLFALLFKYLPSTRVRWGDVWIGAAGAAVLFTAGKYLLGLYLAQTGIASGFGAAGSLAVILVWVFYSSQMLLLGAEFTHLYAQRYGSLRPAGADPGKPAVPKPERRAGQAAV
jgi:membrane protein